MSDTIEYTTLDKFSADYYKNFHSRRKLGGYIRCFLESDQDTFSSSYSVIVADHSFVFGSNNFIIGNDNIVSGHANLVVGEYNTFVKTEFYPDDSTNIQYDMDSEMVLDIIKFSELSRKILESEQNTIMRADLLVQEYYDEHLKTIVDKTISQLAHSLQSRTTRSHRSEPYQVRSLSRTSEKLNTVTQLIGKWFFTYLNTDTDVVAPQHEQMSQWYNNNLRPKFTPPTEPVIRIIPLSMGYGHTSMLPGDLLFLNILSSIMNTSTREEEDSHPHPPPSSILPEKIPDEPDASEAENKCILCYKRSVKTVVIPCGHSYSCVECCHNPNAKQVCAICNQSFSNIIRLYANTL